MKGINTYASGVHTWSGNFTNSLMKSERLLNCTRSTVFSSILLKILHISFEILPYSTEHVNALDVNWLTLSMLRLLASKAQELKII